MQAYDKAVDRLRSPLALKPDMQELVRYATLAPNGHNMQPWKFRIAHGGVSILPDLSRRTPVVDPDDHHLYVSLGCAAENFLLAGEAMGHAGALSYETGGDGRIDIAFSDTSPRGGALFAAIPKRQSTRSDFDGKAVPTADLAQLEAAAAEDGVSLIILTDKAKMEGVIEHVVAGNSAQMDDPGFVAELKNCIRFNPSAALATGDGLFSGCTGNPSLPTWLGRMLFGLFFRKNAENDKYARQIRSSAGVAIFAGNKADRAHWIKVGRSFQRFALQATALGIRHAHINQPVEVASVQAGICQMGSGWARHAPIWSSDLAMRRHLPMSIRRPVSAVIV